MRGCRGACVVAEGCVWLRGACVVPRRVCVFVGGACVVVGGMRGCGEVGIHGCGGACMG